MNNTSTQTSPNRFSLFFAALLGLFLVVGCGGGGGGGGAKLTINAATIAEGDSGTAMMTFTVILSEDSDEVVTLDYATSDGTATAGTDYVAGTGTLTIPAGSLTGDISVSVNGDTDIEDDETLTLKVDNASGINLKKNS